MLLNLRKLDIKKKKNLLSKNNSPEQCPKDFENYSLLTESSLKIISSPLLLENYLEH